MNNSCLEYSPLFNQGTTADRARAFLVSLHAMPVDMWTDEDKQRRMSAMIAIQWARKKQKLARFNGA